MADFDVVVEGLAGIEGALDIGRSVRVRASQALNKTAQRTLTSAARKMREQVNFPATYLTGKDGRLKITKHSTPDDLETIITGRHRATSLARFAANPVPNLKGPTVSVKPGKASSMKRAFLIRLKKGTVLTDTQFNLGLAIRLKMNERIRNKKVMVEIGDTGLYLLYGPSVDQVFRAVAEEEATPSLEFLEREFERLMRLGRG